MATEQDMHRWIQTQNATWQYINDSYRCIVDQRNENWQLHQVFIFFTAYVKEDQETNALLYWDILQMEIFIVIWRLVNDYNCRNIVKSKLQEKTNPQN